MRLDRFITLNLVRPLHSAFRPWSVVCGPSSPSNPRTLPILMYHRVTCDHGPSLPAYYRTNTSPAVFRQHMDYLAEHGYRGVTLPEGLTWLNSPAPRPLQPVVLTFDDGFDNFFTKAFPILESHSFTATVFLPTAFLQNPEPSCRDTEYLTWNEVCGLKKRGIHFGSHTVNHPQLYDLSWNDIDRELRDSKNELESRLGDAITTFSYPCAFPQHDRLFVKRFRNLLAEVGYCSCVTTEIGCVKPGDDPYRLKRLPANSSDDVALFRAKLAGDYDWLALPQRVLKALQPGARPPAKAVFQAG